MRKGHARRQLMLNHAQVQTHPSITVIQQSIHSPRLRKWYLFPSIKYISQANQKIISYVFKKKKKTCLLKTETSLVRRTKSYGW